MLTFRHLLFPVDFSSGCQALASTVRRMVEVWSVDVTLLHPIDEELWLGRPLELERLMRQMKAIAGDGPQARFFGFRLERGQPAVRILEYVRAHPIDLVVIPAGGTSPPVGSMTDQVLAEASCPVWLDWARCAALRRPAWMPEGSVAHSNWASVTRPC
jgi:nucleotide-binding universal stress UspA family protein